MRCSAYLNLKPEHTNIFFKLMEERYRRHSTILTTNLMYDEWPNFLGNRPMAEALLSRLRHCCHAIHIQGPPLRDPQGVKVHHEQAVQCQTRIQPRETGLPRNEASLNFVSLRSLCDSMWGRGLSRVQMNALRAPLTALAARSRDERYLFEIFGFNTLRATRAWSQSGLIP
jgi:hypothetical protein